MVGRRTTIRVAGGSESNEDMIEALSNAPPVGGSPKAKTRYRSLAFTLSITIHRSPFQSKNVLHFQKKVRIDRAARVASMARRASQRSLHPTAPKAEQSNINAGITLMVSR